MKGDRSAHYRKTWQRSTIRICFHEQRLQYIEAEQIAEWSRTHPNERILEIDTPLSYGTANVKQGALNSVSFLWDPTRDTGTLVKVHCSCTEFTPKKHGGERGAPFRLQVSKLKGADRKHKQDREKLAKRPDSERDKFCRSTTAPCSPTSPSTPSTSPQPCLPLSHKKGTSRGTS